MSRVYEVMFIVRPDAAEEDVDKLIAGFSENVTKGGGVVKTVESCRAESTRRSSSD